MMAKFQGLKLGRSNQNYIKVKRDLRCTKKVKRFTKKVKKMV